MLQMICHHLDFFGTLLRSLAFSGLNDVINPLTHLSPMPHSYIP